MIDSIIDIHHENDVDFQVLKDNGVVAVIHKVSEGATWQDPAYQARKKAARQLKLLWGGYHFSSGKPVADQVDNFLNHGLFDDDDLVSLDWEPSHSGANMTLAQAREFVQIVHDRLHRWPCIYGGDLLRDSVGTQQDPILSQCPLWYARYTLTPDKIPTAIWPTYTLWQYTDGKDPEPTPTAGASGADRNRFQGTLDDLETAWPFTKKPAAAPAALAAHVMRARK